MSSWSIDSAWCPSASMVSRSFLFTLASRSAEILDFEPKMNASHGSVPFAVMREPLLLSIDTLLTVNRLLSARSDVLASVMSIPPGWFRAKRSMASNMLSGVNRKPLLSSPMPVASRRPNGVVSPSLWYLIPLFASVVLPILYLLLPVSMLPFARLRLPISMVVLISCLARCRAMVLSSMLPLRSLMLHSGELSSSLSGIVSVTVISRLQLWRCA